MKLFQKPLFSLLSALITVMIQRIGILESLTLIMLSTTQLTWLMTLGSGYGHEKKLENSFVKEKLRTKAQSLGLIKGI